MRGEVGQIAVARMLVLHELRERLDRKETAPPGRLRQGSFQRLREGPLTRRGRTRGKQVCSAHADTTLASSHPHAPGSACGGVQSRGTGRKRREYECGQARSTSVREDAQSDVGGLRDALLLDAEHENDVPSWRLVPGPRKGRGGMLRHDVRGRIGARESFGSCAATKETDAMGPPLRLERARKRKESFDVELRFLFVSGLERRGRNDKLDLQCSRARRAARGKRARNRQDRARSLE